MHIDMDDLVARMMATLAQKRIFLWEQYGNAEEACWRYLREWFPNADEQFLQQIADRVQWEMRPA